MAKLRSSSTSAQVCFYNTAKMCLNNEGLLPRPPQLRPWLVAKINQSNNVGKYLFAQLHQLSK